MTIPHLHPLRAAIRPGSPRFVLFLLLSLSSTVAAAFAQSVPDRFLGAVVLDEPMPTQFVTGQTHWVRGRLVDETIRAMTFAFASERGGGSSIAFSSPTGVSSIRSASSTPTPASMSSASPSSREGSSLSSRRCFPISRSSKGRAPSTGHGRTARVSSTTPISGRM